MRVGDDRVKSASLQRLLKEYENVMFHNGESVDDFAMHINRLVTSLRELDEKMEDGHVVRKILRLVPKKLRQVAVAIEMLVDLDTMTMEELVSRLRMAEAADIEDVAYGMTADGVECLLLMEEQWEARCCQRTGKEETRGSNGGGRSLGHDKDDDNTSTSSGGSRGAGGHH
jgi:hypothetical protein